MAHHEKDGEGGAPKGVLSDRACIEDVNDFTEFASFLFPSGDDPKDEGGQPPNHTGDTGSHAPEEPEEFPRSPPSMLNNPSSLSCAGINAAAQIDLAGAERSGLEIFDDKDDAPLPPAQISAAHEAKERGDGAASPMETERKLELMDDGEEARPMNPFQMAAFNEEADEKSGAKNSKGTPETINDDTGPMQPSFHEAGRDKKLPAKPKHSRLGGTNNTEGGSRNAQRDPSRGGNDTMVPNLPSPPPQVGGHGGDPSDGADQSQSSEATARQPPRRILPSPNVDGQASSAPMLEATLVPDQDEITLYEATHVPGWQRHQKFLIGGLISILSVGLVAAIVANVGDGGDNTIPPPTPPTTLQQSGDPPATTLNCTVQDLGAIFEAKELCSWCTHVVGRDGDALALVVSDNFGDTPTNFMLLPSEFPDFNIVDIAFSRDWFFSTNPVEFLGNASVYAVPKNKLGLISDGPVTTITPDDLTPDDPQSGFGISIDADRDALLVGSPWENEVYIFRETDAGSWEKEEKIVRNGSSQFGNSVLLRGDLAVVADYHYDNDNNKSGAVFFYEFDPSLGEWQGITNSTLVQEDCVGEFGVSLAFAGDNGLLIGCPQGDNDQGTIYYYQRPADGGRFDLAQSVTIEDGNIDLFGHIPINSDGDLLLIRSAGLLQTVYVFGKRDNRWKEVARIDAPDGAVGFGTDMVIAGDRVLITAQQNSYAYILDCAEQAQDL